MNNITITLWDATFPTIPAYVIPTTMPVFLDVESLIDYVCKNTRAIEDNWTYTIRQSGIQGRLQMSEDDSKDEKFRAETLRRSIKSAKVKLLNS